MDNIDAQRRSENMRRIKSRNTKPELLVRRLVWSLGFRGYRTHWKTVPGKPDIAWVGKKKAIFVHGCFWHGHSGCSLAKVPGTRTEFWREKFESNRQRDRVAAEALRVAGWRVLVVWECFTRRCKTEDALMQPLTHWIESSSPLGELRSEV